MKLLFASDSFKGTISSEQTVEFLTKAAHEVFGPCETIGVPVADGGEGTTDAVILARKRLFWRWPRLPDFPWYLRN